MADLIRREPFRALRRGDPFSQLREMQRDMERLFSEFFGTAPAPVATVTAEWVPLAETYMKGDDIVGPGMKLPQNRRSKGRRCHRGSGCEKTIFTESCPTGSSNGGLRCPQAPRSTR